MRFFQEWRWHGRSVWSFLPPLSSGFGSRARFHSCRTLQNQRFIQSATLEWTWPRCRHHQSSQWCCTPDLCSHQCWSKILVIVFVDAKAPHMGLEHASREKKLPMVNFLIFVHKNVYRIRFQEIKIRPWKGFEKFAFWFFAHYKISPSKGPKYP